MYKPLGRSVHNFKPLGEMEEENLISVSKASTKDSSLGRVENQKSLIFFKSQAGLYGAHKNKIIHHILKFQNIRFHIGNAPRRGFFENFKICL